MSRLYKRKQEVKEKKQKAKDRKKEYLIRLVEETNRQIELNEK